MSKEKFKTLANARVNKVIKLMILVGNLSNKSHYTYTPQQADKIIKALQSEISLIKSKFTNPKGGRDQKEFEIE